MIPSFFSSEVERNQVVLGIRAAIANAEAAIARGNFPPSMFDELFGLPTKAEEAVSAQAELTNLQANLAAALTAPIYTSPAYTVYHQGMYHSTVLWNGRRELMDVHKMVCIDDAGWPLEAHAYRAEDGSEWSFPRIN